MLTGSGSYRSTPEWVSTRADPSVTPCQTPRTPSRYAESLDLGELRGRSNLVRFPQSLRGPRFTALRLRGLLRRQTGPPDSPGGVNLCFAEREEIALLRAQDHGVREIARRLGRDPATISRELRRNAATRAGQRVYRAGVAQWKAQQAAKRPKAAKLATNPRLRAYVERKLAGEVTDADGRPIAGPKVPWAGRRHGRRRDRRWGVAWSPEHISNRLVIDFPDDESMRVSQKRRSTSRSTSKAAARSSGS